MNFDILLRSNLQANPIESLEILSIFMDAQNNETKLFNKKKFIAVKIFSIFR